MIKGELTPPGEAPRPTARGNLHASIDQVSKSIIELLQVDGRRSFASIAEELGVPEGAVERRVAQLVADGVISITAVSDPLQLGFARQAMLGITVEPGLAKPVAEKLAQIPEIVYVVITAGAFDLIVEVVGTSDAHLLELTSQIKPTPGVVAIETFLYLQLQKQTYTWGVK